MKALIPFNQSRTVLSLSVLLLAAVAGGGCAGASDMPTSGAANASASTQRSAPIPKPAILNAAACAPTRTDYPDESWRAGEAGTVVMEFVVKSDGSLKSSDVVKSSGYPKLDSVALTKLSSCQFAPARSASGQPVDGKLNVEYVWKRF